MRSEKRIAIDIANALNHAANYDVEYVLSLVMEAVDGGYKDLAEASRTFVELIYGADTEVDPTRIVQFAGEKI